MDMLFFGDTGGTPEDYGGNHEAAVRYGAKWPRHDMAPMIPLMAKAAPGVGFALTMSTTYHHPFYIARFFNALDHVTRGRIAWNAVTSAYKNEAANYGFDDDDGPRRALRARAGISRSCLQAMGQRRKGCAGRRSREGHIRRSGQGAPDRSPRPVFQRPRSASGIAVAATAAGHHPGRSFGSRHGPGGHLRRYAVQHAPHARQHEAASRGARCQTGLGRPQAARHRNSLVDPHPGRRIRGRCQGEGAALSRRDTDRKPVWWKCRRNTTSISPRPGPACGSPISPTRCARRRATTEASRNCSRRPIPPRPSRSSAAAFWSIGSWSRPVRRSRSSTSWKRCILRSGANGGFILGRGYSAMDNIREFVELVVPELQRRGLSKRKYTGPTLRENLN